MSVTAILRQLRYYNHLCSHSSKLKGLECGSSWAGGLAVENKEPDSVQHEVLSGWKDIALYLGKGVRTVQRYERQLGLPVRRPSGHPSGSVVAIKSELDGWVKSSPMNPLDPSQRLKQVYLSSEIAKGFQERAHLHAQMMALRKGLKTNIRRLHESIAKVRQQLNETRKRQDSIESMIRQHSRKVWQSTRLM